MRGYQPRPTVPAVPTESGGIRFLGLRSQYDIPSQYAGEVWAILSQCTGHLTDKRIVTLAHRARPESSIETLRTLIDDLTEAGILADGRRASKEFHRLSNNPPPFPEYISPEEVERQLDKPLQCAATGGSYPLTEPDDQLTALLRKRATCRTFSAESIGLNEVGAMLFKSYGADLRPVPSAGALYPLRLYLIVVRAGQGLPLGYYEYDAIEHRLVRFAVEIDIEMLRYIYGAGGQGILDAPAILVIAGDLDRQMQKYTNRGYRYTLLEAGHVAQSCSIAAVEQGLATWEYGGFIDMPLQKELGMPESVVPLTTVAIGRSDVQLTAEDSATSVEWDDEGLRRVLVGRQKPVRSVTETFGLKPEQGEYFYGVSAHHISRFPGHRERGNYAFGSGSSPAEARVKAIGEAYERWRSGQLRIDLVATATELELEWVDPRRNMPLTDEQYSQQVEVQPFHEDIPTQWVRGRRLFTNTPVWVPVDLVFYPLYHEDVERDLFCEASSSGVAAHPTYEGAVLGGLLELLERDAIMRRWLSRKPASRIAYDVLPYSWRRRVDFWQGRDRKVHVLDHSHDGVYIVEVMIVGDTYPCFTSGASAGLSYESVLRKAFHEAELTMFNDIKTQQKRRPVTPRRVRTPSDHGELYLGPRYRENLTWAWSGPESSMLLQRPAQPHELYQWTDAVAVDLSEVDMPIRVVRVLSSQLVPINFGYGNEHYTHPGVTDLDPKSLTLPHYFA